MNAPNGSSWRLGTRSTMYVEEAERARIAHELHDDVAQRLAALIMSLHETAATTDMRAREAADRSLQLAEALLRHIRSVALCLHPPLLDTLGLVSAIQHMVDECVRDTGSCITVSARPRTLAVDHDIAIACYRVVQEAVTNAIRHARANRIRIRLRQRRHLLLVTVHDDGMGFVVPSVLTRALVGVHVGVLGMRARVLALGGRFAIDSSPGHGTAVYAILPRSRVMAVEPLPTLPRTVSACPRDSSHGSQVLL
jgi:signal transduction histidine kinase